MGSFSIGNPAIRAIGDDGREQPISVDSIGNQRVSINEPLSPFGEVNTVQTDLVEHGSFIYGISTSKYSLFTGSGGQILQSGSLLLLSSSTTAGSYASIRGNRYTKGNLEKGAIFRGAAKFGPSASLSSQQFGVGQAEDGLFFGYNNTEFSILRRHAGKLHIMQLDVLTGSSTAENITINLNGTNYTAAVTNNASTTTTAAQIAANGTWSGSWSSQAVSASVYLYPLTSPSLLTGSFSVTASTAVSQFTTLRSGAADQQDWVTQSDWNIDPMDGTGPSGITLEPDKFNLYEIKYSSNQVDFSIQDPLNGRMHPVHIEKGYQNDEPLLQDNALAFNSSVVSFGTTQPLELQAVSFGLYNYDFEDPIRTVGHTNSVAGIGTSFTNVLALRNSPLRGGKINRTNLRILNISVAVEGTKPAEVKIYKNPTLSGYPIFTRHDSDLGLLESADISTTNSTVSSAGEIYAFGLAKSSYVVLSSDIINILLARDETISVAVRATGGTVDATVSVSWDTIE